MTWQPTQQVPYAGDPYAQQPGAQQYQQPGNPQPGNPQQGYGQQGYGQPDYPQPVGGPGSVVPPPKRGGGKSLMIGAAVAVVAVVAAGGAFAWTKFTSNGDQPESHLPASTAAMFKVDLDPSAAQKVDALRFMSKFPATKSASEQDDLRKALYEEVVKAGASDLPTWDETKTWLGNRAAFAVVPGGGSDAAAVPVFLLQVTDESKAASQLKTLTKGEGGTAVGGGWAYISDTQAHADSILSQSKSGTLADQGTFSSDMERLGDAGLATAWFDIAKVVTLKKTSGIPLIPESTLSSMGQVEGHGGVALHFDGGALELVGAFRGKSSPGVVPGKTGVESLPADSLAAIGAANLGDALTKGWPEVSKSLGETTVNDLKANLEQSVGLTMPDDISALLGQQFAVAVGKGDGKTPAVGVRALTNSDRASTALSKLLDLASQDGPQVFRRDINGGYVVSSSTAQADALAQGGGTLGQLPKFKSAVPKADNAVIVGYVDIAGLVDTFGSSMGSDDLDQVKPLDALGLSVTADDKGNSEFRLRLTVR